MTIDNIHHIEIYTKDGQVISVDFKKFKPIILMIQKSSFLSAILDSTLKQCQN